MRLILFEDEQVTRLDPVALGKPAFAIHCGGFRLIELASQGGMSLAARVRPHLRALVAADYPELSPGNDVGARDERSLVAWVNARLVPSAAVFERLRTLLMVGSPGIVHSNGAVAAAIVPARAAFGESADALPTAADFAALKLAELQADLPLFEYPHDIVRHHLATLAANLQQRLGAGAYLQKADGMFLAPEASLGAHVTTDTRRGPIVLEERASVGPHCHLVGPVWIGPDARVIEQASIKDAVSIGRFSKVGGEVEASIIEPYSNKQHFGFLGHSYLGSWINLGAGTSNSDLKNSYGQVRVEYRGAKVATGMQFLGTIVGDYAKTAIQTGIFTGKIIGACSMVYGFATTNVPSFVNYARQWNQVTALPPAVMAVAQQRMFQRRGVAQRPEDVRLLEAMYELTSHERAAWDGEIADRPLSL